MNKLNKQQQAELTALAAKPDNEIDTSEIPEVTDWSGAVVGRFYRPIKQVVTVRIDADVLDWFKSQGGKYQTRLNGALREYMTEHRKHG